MGFKQQRARKSPRKLILAQHTPAASAIATVTRSTTTMHLAFNKPVVVNAVPTGITVQGQPATGLTITDSKHIILTFAANVVATNVWVIPANEPHIRTQEGGFVAGSTGIFS